MTQDTKALIEITLETLRKINIDNDVSMGFDKKNKTILFFDTETYISTGKFDGFAVKLNSLVE